MGNRDYLLYVRESNDNRKWKHIPPAVIDNNTPSFKLGKVSNPQAIKKDNRKFEYMTFQFQPQQTQQVTNDITNNITKLPVRDDIPDQWDQVAEMDLNNTAK